MLAAQAAGDRSWARLRHDQQVAYTVAQLVAVAVNNPRKMPDFEKVFPDRRSALASKAITQAPEEALLNMKLWMAAAAASHHCNARKDVTK